MALHCATRPSWAVDIARGHLRRRGSRHGRVAPHAMQRDMLRSLYPVTAQDLADLRAGWSGPLVVKGVLRPADCACCSTTAPTASWCPTTAAAS